MRTTSCMATLALRMRVSMSAIGSVIVNELAPSPAGLRDARHLAGVDHLAQTDATEPELPVHGPRPSAAPAARVGAYPVLRLARRLLDQCLLRQLSSALPSERKTESGQEGPALGVRACRSDDGDIHSPRDVDLVVIDLGEDQLLVHAERVVAATVERGGRQATEVTHPRDRQADQPVEELPHPVASQRHLGADRVALAQLEPGDRALRLGDERLLARDDREISDRALEERGLADGPADSHVDHDLLEPRNLHDVAEPELVTQARPDLVVVALLEPGPRDHGRHQISAPHLRQMRTLA